MSAAYFGIGFSPITALAVAIIGILPLSVSTLSIVLPATLLGAGLALRFPNYGKLALQGLLIGLIAVFLYDCMRVPFIITGIWGDFIPKINMWLFNTSQPNRVAGYVWRYIGDGGYMGMAFTEAYCILRPRVDSRIAGVGFGLAIWMCLLGHLIYGMTLGMLIPYVQREKMTGKKPGLAAIKRSQDALETMIGEEETVKLPPLLRMRPIWEHKTAPLSLL